MTAITLEQIINFLLDAPMFGGLDPAELSEIVHIMQVQRVRDEHAIFREGDPGDAWYVVYDGAVSVVRADATGTPRSIAELGPRSCFGEMAILDHFPRSATVVSQGESTIFKFPRVAFERLLREENLAAYKLIHEMAKVLALRSREGTQALSEALRAKDEPHRLLTTSARLVDDQSVSE